MPNVTVRLRTEVRDTLTTVGSNLEEVGRLLQENATLLRRVLGLETLEDVPHLPLEVVHGPLEAVEGVAG